MNLVPFLALLLASTAGPAGAQNRCAAAKMKAAGKSAACVLGQDAKAAAGDPLDAIKVQKCKDKMSATFAKAELRPPCPAIADFSAIESMVDSFESDVVAALVVGEPSRCQTAKIRAAGKEAKCLLGIHSGTAKTGVPADQLVIQRCRDRLTDAFAAAETGTDCRTTGDAVPTADRVEIFVADVVEQISEPDLPPSTTTTVTTLPGPTSSTTTLPCGTLVGEWGGPGTGLGEFTDIGGLDTDGSLWVYVADTGNHRIQRVYQDGSLVFTWGSQGNGDGEFESPADVAYQGGYVYVADTLNHRIQKFDYYGNFIIAWGHQGSADGAFLAPAGIHVDSGNNVLVADTGNHRIQMFSADGTFRTKWGVQGTGDGEFESPRDVAAVGSEYYVADTGNQRIQVFDLVGFELDAVFQRKWTVSGSPAGLTPGPANGEIGLFVADETANLVDRFHTSGTLLDAWTPAGSPRGVGWGAAVIFVTNGATQTLQKFACD